MSEKTNIEWTDHTFNPWWGCARVSPGCRFCYADRDATRYGHTLWRRRGDRRMLSDANWAKPIKWNRDAEHAGTPAKVFCASMADVFEDHPQVTESRKRLWDLIDATPWLIWQLLTKRPENVADMAPWGARWPPNIWLGTSVEDQPRANQRIPVLLDLAAQITFLSCEPLLGPLSLFANTKIDKGRLVDWVIVGGESGPRARPMHPSWARHLRDECVRYDIPFLFKQWGEWAPAGTWPGPDHHIDVEGHLYSPGEATPERMNIAAIHRWGKKQGGRTLDGRTWDEYPAART